MICIEACSEPSHTSKIELFAQIVNVLKLLTIFARNSQASIVNSLNLRNLSSRLRSSCKAFWWHLFCASENLFKIWAISLRAYLFERICLDFSWGATTIFFFFEQVVQCLYLLEFHLPNFLLDFPFRNINSLDFYRGFHYAHSQMRCLLRLKINWWFHFPHKKLDLNVWSSEAPYQGIRISPLPLFMWSVVLLQSCFRALYFTLTLSMPVSISLYFKTMPFLFWNFFSLIFLNESNSKAFINSCWICIKTSLFEDFLMQVFLGFPQIHYPDLTESQQNIFVSSCVQRLEFF